MSLDDEAGLRDLLADAAAVINCAGPFTLAGDALVRAAIDTGTHYVDSTGEQSFIQMVFDRHGEAARAGRRGAGARRSASTTSRATASRASLPRGTSRSTELVLAYSRRRLRDDPRDPALRRSRRCRAAASSTSGGDWRPAPGGVFRASFDFPQPLGRQTMSRYPSGEVITVPRHTQHAPGRSMLSTATPRRRSPLRRRSCSLRCMPGLELAMRTPLRGLLQEAVSLLPEGPAEARPPGRALDDRRGRARGATAHASRVVVTRHRRLRAHRGDPRATRRTLLTRPDFDRAGALGPAAAFDPVAFLNFLGDHGVSWER